MSLRDYFSNNKIFTGTEKPTQGKFGVGDIIVNIGPNSAEEPMWICVEAGTPGVWELCSGVNEEEIADIVQANALSAVDYTDGVDIQIDGGEIGNMNELQTTDKSSIVGAINELFQSANNGKELIANAIGEPLDASDTFSAMSNDINGLLATFKTNMMNSGVTVESNDRFKSLIDKIKGLTEGEGNKGIQFATGNISNTSLVSEGNNVYVEVTDLNFKPDIILVLSVSGDNKCIAAYNRLYRENTSFHMASSSAGWFESTIDSGKFSINEAGFKILINYYGATKIGPDTSWCAIGVGEEDTTLRDSLADILGDKGVEVNPEDDMASLITKIDSINTIPSNLPPWMCKNIGQYDFISCKSLPTKRAYLSSALVGDKIYYIAGYNGTDYKPIVECYDTKNNTWESKKQGLYYTSSAGCVSDGNKIYLLGGDTGGSRSSNWNQCYDTLTNTWSEKKTMIVAATGFACAKVDSLIHCMGGYSSSALTNHQVYDITNNTWTSRTALAYERRYAEAASIGTNIYFIGGTTGSNESYNMYIKLYDSVANTWSYCTSSYRSYRFSISVYNGKIYMVGGYSDNLKNIVVFDPSKDTISTVSTLPLPFQGHASEVVGNCMYIGGGMGYYQENYDCTYATHFCIML